MRNKILFALLFLFPIICYSADDQFTTYPHFNLGGWVTNAKPELLDPKYSPDLLNVWTTRHKNIISKRNGCSSYLNTPLAGQKWYRGAYNYTQVDGDEYILLQSSTSMFYSKNGDGNTTQIRSDLNETSIANITTAKNVAYIVDGTTHPWKFDGSTTTVILDNIDVSTNVPNAYFCKWWNNKMFYARTDTYPSRVWYSSLDVPEYVGANDYKNINVSDGDYITGMFLYNNRLIITKRFSTWELIDITGDSDTPFYQIRNISENIGSLYQNTMREWKGFPVWMSHRGIELYDGTFNLVSEPIDPYIKSLRQLVAGRFFVSQDTSADWGAGTVVNVDTTTYSGSVTMYGEEAQIENNNMYFTVYQSTYYGVYGAYWFRQSFYTENDTKIDSLSLVCESDGTTDTLLVGIGQGNLVANDPLELIVSSSIVVSASISTTTIKFDTEITILKNTTYYIGFYTDTPLYLGRFFIYGNSLNPYTRGDAYGHIGGVWGVWGSSYGLDCYFHLWNSSPIYTSQVLEATSWGAWGNLVVDETKPTGSNIAYYVKTSTASDNFASKTQTLVSNGGSINSSVGGFIQVISSFSRTDITAVPKLNSFSISYQATSDIKKPYAIVHEDNYYIAVSTDSDNPENNVVLVMQNDGEWTRFNGSCMNWGSAFIYNGELYSCDSQDTGKIYLHDVENLYSDDGNAYSAYWTSKIFNFGQNKESTLFDIMPFASEAGDWNLTVDYRLHGSNGVWDSVAMNLYSATFGIITEVLGLPFPKSYFFQYRIRNDNSGESFEYRGSVMRYLIESL